MMLVSKGIIKPLIIHHAVLNPIPLYHACLGFYVMVIAKCPFLNGA
jgi:hypothetical protein